MYMKICIDAGHYGKYNRSPANKAYYESDMNWKLHNLLKKYLEQHGVEVIQTRANKDADMGLTARGRAAAGCDLFLSIHSNAAGSKVKESVDYPIVYVPLNGSGDEIGKKLAECIEKTMGTKQKAKCESKKGNNGDYYGVIRGAVSVGVPGLILEHSFHTNNKMTNWLLKDANLDKLAQAEAAVIAEHYGIEVKPPQLEVDGKWGKATTTRLQQIFGTTVDGKVSNQIKKYKKENPGLTGGWDWKLIPNGKGSQLIKAMQKWADMPEKDRDGEIGPKTIKAIQTKLGTKVDGYVSYPSKMVKALQEWANKQ
jgi:N-acetylmuramoyl-L-alanine amidase